MGIPAGWFQNLPCKMIAEIQDSIFKIRTEEEFWETTRRVYNHQSLNNQVYKEFAAFLGRDSRHVNTASDIPFLPVEFFRNHRIITGERQVEIIFESSGTTGVTPGRHYVSDLALYERSFLRSFRLFYGEPGDYLIIALLPSYTERGGSSLVYMADILIKESHHPQSGFYKSGTDAILNAVKKGKEVGSRILLLGVSYALLDLAESGSRDFSGITIMETGGMKGRRKELTRSELHNILKEKFNVNTIHSEYGMTELMSQAYSSGDGIFYCPPWMKIVLRDPQDPLSLFSQPGKTGGINIIDLANLNSCSFIATGDLGKLHENGGFEVLGRFDNSDIRGCNLMAE
jgi:phenylacetate-coenzyme A ligase PaaK-like adenylate-forming protein